MFTKNMYTLCVLNNICMHFQNNYICVLKIICVCVKKIYIYSMCFENNMILCVCFEKYV